MKKKKQPVARGPREKRRADEALRKCKEYTEMRDAAAARRKARKEAVEERVKNYSLEYLKEKEPTALTAQSRQWYSRQIQQRVRADRRRRREERRRLEANDEELPEELQRGETRTIENTRGEDPCRIERTDQEVVESFAADEFASYFSRETKPQLMVTTCKNPCPRLLRFVTELQQVIPNFYYFPRRNFKIKSIVNFGTKNDYTDVLVFTQSRDAPYGLWVSHLPEGPTSFFRLSSVKLAREIRKAGDMTDHAPEIIFNNFESHVGVRAMRQLMALFPQDPEFRGRRVITFHNQRDFIFFRHHRYIFATSGERTRLQEIGPRFTLKLYSMHRGTFDPKEGEYEYFWRAEMNVDRRAAYL